MEKATFDTEELRETMLKNGIATMDLVRLCGIGVDTAYKIKNSQPISDLNVFYKVYQGLKTAGYPVTWEKLTGIK